MLRRFLILFSILAVSCFGQKPSFTVGWSIYAGWTPYSYMAKSGLL
jgi:NitT/TauT family transport system substrate-binding protein